MRAREPEDVLEEIEYKLNTYGIRRFGFYEDNALVLRGHLQRILELIIERGLKLELYAPEGFETRLLTVELLRTMRAAGFEKVHLPFEALRWETNLGWNRRHSSTASFDRALDAAITAGFRPRTEEINAFVLFGLPDDSLEHIVDGLVYVHHAVGSIIPMLFTPVPGTQIYREQQHYLHRTQGWDLQHLNGKFLPFLEYNRGRYPGLRGSDYLQFEALMSVLNKGKVLQRSVDLCDDHAASQGFRSAASRIIEAASNGSRPRPSGSRGLTGRESNLGEAGDLLRIYDLNGRGHDAAQLAAVLLPQHRLQGRRPRCSLRRRSLREDRLCEQGVATRALRLDRRGTRRVRRGAFLRKEHRQQKNGVQRAR
jgi:hypothetical protein